MNQALVMKNTKKTKQNQQRGQRIANLSMFKCRYCKETRNLSHYHVRVPTHPKSDKTKPRHVMHCNRCGYNRVAR